MIHPKRVTAILLLAGQSTRMGGGKNKVISQLAGKHIFLYSLELFSHHPAVDEILVAVNPAEEALIRKYTERAHLSTPISFVSGGRTRQQSVLHCLNSATGDYVIIHDGARPFIKAKYIDECLEELKTHKGVSVGVPAKDTIKLTNEHKEVISTTHRPTTWITQTPQAFHTSTLLSLHKKCAPDSSVTDDCSLLEQAGFAVKMVLGDYTNLKLTTPEDLVVMELMADVVGKSSAKRAHK